MVQLLTAIIACPSARFSSITLQRNVQVQMHTDTMQVTLRAPLSPAGGSLWIQNSGGAHALDAHSGPGTMQRISWPYIRFRPHLRHATTPWTSRDRTILIGYMVNSLHRLTDEERHSLRYYGFRLP